MTTTGKPIIYWDACVLLAWLRNETRAVPSEMEGVARVVAAWDDDDLKLLTSVITQLEVLPNTLTDEQRQRFDTTLARPEKFFHADVTGPIIKLARSIRNVTDINNETIGTPDAIHLATAIVNGATEFHTFDGAGKKKKRKLIPLSGLPLVEGLVIRVPDFVVVAKKAPAKDKTLEGQSSLFEKEGEPGSPES